VKREGAGRQYVYFERGVDVTRGRKSRVGRSHGPGRGAEMWDPVMIFWEQSSSQLCQLISGLRQCPDMATNKTLSRAQNTEQQMLIVHGMGREHGATADVPLHPSVNQR
jgi:hypothetical protein